MTEDEVTDLHIGPQVKVYIEHEFDEDQFELVELKIPFLPRVGDCITWKEGGEHRVGFVQRVDWVLTASEEGTRRVQNVNIHTTPEPDGKFKVQGD